MPTCHCLRDRYLSEGTSVSSQMWTYSGTVFQGETCQFIKQLGDIVCYGFECIVMYSCGGLLSWRSPQRWRRVFLHCSNSLGLLIHASPSATGLGPQAFCLPQRWSLSSSPSSSHSSTPWGEKSSKVAAEIRTLIWLQSNQYKSWIIRVVRFTFLLASTFWRMFGQIRFFMIKKKSLVATCQIFVLCKNVFLLLSILPCFPFQISKHS